MSIRCVVCYENHRRLIELPLNSTEDDVRVAISLKFEEILDVGSSLIQVFNEEFKCYLDYDETTVLKDKDFIFVTEPKKESQQGQCRKCSSALAIEAQLPPLPLQPHHHQLALPQPQQLLPLPPVAAPQHGSASFEQNGPVRSSSALDYTLPELPYDIAAALHTFKSAVDIPSAFRNRIVLWLYRDLSQYSLYPGKLYAEAARQLVVRYGQLRDAVGSGYDSWQRALRFKAKYERRKLSDAADVQANKVKYGRKQHSPSTEAKRICRDFNLPELITGPDNGFSVESHIGWMVSELKKPCPDVERVSDSMRITFENRRSWLRQRNPPVGEILEKFPALARQDQVFEEFSRITHVDPLQKLYEVVDHYCDSVVQLSAGNRAATIVGQALHAASFTSGDAKRDLTCLAFFVALPSLLKESHTSFIKANASLPVYPVVLCSEEDLLGGKECFVQIDACIFKADSPSRAVLTAFCLYWVLNFKYEAWCRRTFCIIENLMGLDISMPSGMCIQLLSTLKKHGNV